MKFTLLSVLFLSACQGAPVNGFNTPPNVWILPACIFFCTSHLGKEDVSSTGNGAASGGGITSTSSSTATGGGN